MRLDGKKALVTGSDSGVGQAIAAEFAKAGADVCITFHKDEAGAAETRRLVEAEGRRAMVSCLVAQHLPTPGSGPYGMAKAGLGSLTRSLAVELAPHRGQREQHRAGPHRDADDAGADQRSGEARIFAQGDPLRPHRAAGRDRPAGAVSRLRPRGLRHGPDLDHGWRAPDELGRGVSEAPETARDGRRATEMPRPKRGYPFAPTCAAMAPGRTGVYAQSLAPGR